MAKAKQANYLKLVGRDLPADTWRFFTADQENIDKLTAALGFSYKRAGKEYTHPGRAGRSCRRTARSCATSTACSSCPSISRWASTRPRRAR